MVPDSGEDPTLACRAPLRRTIPCRHIPLRFFLGRPSVRLHSLMLLSSFPYLFTCPLFDFPSIEIDHGAVF
ncbi:hypothetical protein SDC9_167336 [bioreactor metagenome]|uniref:Uncharacterized protein n=1 Tax=bioreactor metagenome TaxID=1076179 RepID=A0A645FZI3_9ZZZZ